MKGSAVSCQPLQTRADPRRLPAISVVGKPRNRSATADIDRQVTSDLAVALSHRVAFEYLGFRIGAEPGALRHIDGAVFHRNGLRIGREANVGEQSLERGSALLRGDRMQGSEVARSAE